MTRCPTVRYDGGGIYRHVSLTAVDPLHVLPYGVYAPSHVTSEITDNSDNSASAAAALNCTVDVANFNSADAKFVIISTVVDQQTGAVVASKSSDPITLAAGTNTTYACGEIAMSQATLWSIEDPHLYTLVTRISTTANTVGR